MMWQIFSRLGVVCGLATILTSPTMAGGALAVGLPSRGVSGGFVYGVSTDDPKAGIKAMNICRGIDLTNNKVPDRPTEAQNACKLAGTFQDKCVAVAYNGTQHIASTGVGWAIASNSATAKREAITKCDGMRQRRGAECEIATVLCDGTAN